MKYAVWIPWVRFFYTKVDGSIVLFTGRDDADSWVDAANAYSSTLRSCDHGAGCRQCRYRVVPWDQQAQDIANGVVKP